MGRNEEFEIIINQELFIKSLMIFGQSMLYDLLQCSYFHDLQNMNKLKSI